MLRTLPLLVLSYGLCLAASPCAAAPQVDPRPNIVIIVADDLGWADVGFHRGRIPTPQLDRLASDGVQLSQHYVSPMCSPTRAALLSGRFASRFGVVSATNSRVFRPGTTTLASALKAAGYDTAIIGKWHLGSEPKSGPLHYGFDRSYGSLAGGVGPYTHQYQDGPYTKTWQRDHVFVQEEGHVTDLLTKEAIQWIEQRSNSRPFFLYLAFTVPHHPLQEPPEWVNRFPGIQPLSHRHYVAAVAHMDNAIGQVLAKLEASGRKGNTLVLFFSDNGAIPDDQNNRTEYPPGSYPEGPVGSSNAPLRGCKGQLYEGGIRVPAVAYWPARLKPGTTTAPVHVADWMPTLTTLAGYEGKSNLKWDGRDVWPLLTGRTQPVERVFYWLGLDHSRAGRRGDWKLIVHSPQLNRADELFNLAADPGEQTNVASGQPERVAALKRVLEEAARSDNDALAEPDLRK